MASTGIPSAVAVAISVFWTIAMIRVAGGPAAGRL
jgi:hypothetical protein